METRAYGILLFRTSSTDCSVIRTILPEHLVYMFTHLYVLNPHLEKIWRKFEDHLEEPPEKFLVSVNVR